MDKYNLTTRPLSPHITIYRKQINSVLSILHRISGIGIFLGLSVITWLLILYVYSNFDSFFVSMFNSLWFKLLLYLTVYATCFHLCTGIRHLIWDIGYGFSIKSVNVTGWIAVILSIIVFFACIYNFLF